MGHDELGFAAPSSCFWLLRTDKEELALYICFRLSFVLFQWSIRLPISAGQEGYLSSGKLVFIRQVRSTWQCIEA